MRQTVLLAMKKMTIMRLRKNLTHSTAEKILAEIKVARKYFRKILYWFG